MHGIDDDLVKIFFLKRNGNNDNNKPIQTKHNVGRR